MFKTSSTNETRRKNDKRSDIFINRTLEIRTRRNLLFFYNPFLKSNEIGKIRSNKFISKLDRNFINEYSYNFL